MTLSRLFVVLLIIRCAESISYPCNSTATCGCSQNSATVSRIVGGEAAAAATWSWAVSLLIAPGYLCGGSILSQFWVVTAAHCVKSAAASAVTVYAGSNQQWRGTQTRQVSRIFVHPSYNSVTYTNDIALLQLSRPLDITDSTVATICLPSVDSTTLANSEWPIIGTSVSALWFHPLNQFSIVSSLSDRCCWMGENHGRWILAWNPSTSDVNHHRSSSTKLQPIDQELASADVCGY